MYQFLLHYVTFEETLKFRSLFSLSWQSFALNRRLISASYFVFSVKHSASLFDCLLMLSVLRSNISLHAANTVQVTFGEKIYKTYLLNAGRILKNALKKYIFPIEKTFLN